MARRKGLNLLFLIPFLLCLNLVSSNRNSWNLKDDVRPHSFANPATEYRNINPAVKHNILGSTARIPTEHDSEKGNNLEMLATQPRKHEVNTFIHTPATEKLTTNRRKREDADAALVETVKETVRNVMNNAIFPEVESDNSNKTALEKWIRVSEITENVISTLMRPLLPRLYEMSYDADLSPECSSSLTSFVFDIMRMKSYAFKVLDSWGKPMAGFLKYSVSALGNYDECLSINELDRNQEEYFRGQYCMVHIWAPLPPKPKFLSMFTPIFNFSGTPLEGTFFEEALQTAVFHHERPVRLGICVPATCSKDEIQRLLKTALSQQDILTADINHCEALEPPKWEKYQIAIIIIFCIQLALLIIGTLVDVTNELISRYGTNILKTFRDFMSCFSVRANAREVLDAKPLPGDIGALHGIRVLSMIWLIYSHTYLHAPKEVSANAMAFILMVRELLFQGIMNGHLIVDTFFFMAALLFTYTSLRKIKKSKGLFNIPQAIFNRIYRLWFPIAFCVLFTLIWFNLSHGPLWKEIVSWHVDRCKKTWWATLLFFHNFMNVDNICLEFSWYLAADIQLFIFFLPLLIILFKWRKIGIVSIFIIIALGAISSVIVVYVKGYPPVPLFTYVGVKPPLEVLHVVHLWTNFHIPTYGIGILTGLLLYKKPTISVPKVVCVIGWITSICMIFFCVWISYFWNNNQLKNTFVYLSWAFLQRICWSLPLAWITYMCATGNGGIVNKILSSPVYLPFSRLTFSTYLVSQLIMWTREGMRRQAIYFNRYNLFCEFIVYTVISYLVAICFYLAIEAPFSAIHRKYLGSIGIFRKAQITIKQQQPNESAKEDVSTKL